MKSRIYSMGLLAAVMLGLTGCFKSVSYNTVCVLKPLVQIENQSPVVGLAGVRVYAFDVDTVGWTVANYQDALQGVLTSRLDGGKEKLSEPVATGIAYGKLEGAVDSENWLQMELSTPVVTLLVVDTENKLYGFRRQDLGENLSPLYVSVVFRPWKPAKVYQDGVWYMFNDFYEPTTPAPGV